MSCTAVRVRVATGTVLMAAMAAVSTAVVVVAPQPAYASARERVVSAHDMSSPKDATATCPTGTKVIAAGGKIVDGDGGVILASVVPDLTLTSVTVRGESLPDHEGAWSVVATAVCGYSLSVHRETSKDSTTATCGEGSVVGTGFKLAGKPGEMLLTGVTPGAAEVSVDFVRLGTGSALPTAYAICAQTSTWDMSVEQGLLGVSTPRMVNASTYPKPVRGVGARIRGSAPNVFIDAMLPDNDEFSASVRAVQLNWPALYRVADDGNGIDVGWSVDAYAIAADYY